MHANRVFDNLRLRTFDRICTSKFTHTGDTDTDTHILHLSAPAFDNCIKIPWARWCETKWKALWINYKRHETDRIQSVTPTGASKCATQIRTYICIAMICVCVCMPVPLQFRVDVLVWMCAMAESVSEKIRTDTNGCHIHQQQPRFRRTVVCIIIVVWWIAAIRIAGADILLSCAYTHTRERTHTHTNSAILNSRTHRKFMSTTTRNTNSNDIPKGLQIQYVGRVTRVVELFPERIAYNLQEENKGLRMPALLPFSLPWQISMNATMSPEYFVSHLLAASTMSARTAMSAGNDVKPLSDSICASV